jgi:hypothetical protein
MFVPVCFCELVTHYVPIPLILWGRESLSTKQTAETDAPVMMDHLGRTRSAMFV